jgi:callose synthase
VNYSLSFNFLALASEFFLHVFLVLSVVILTFPLLFYEALCGVGESIQNRAGVLQNTAMNTALNKLFCDLNQFVYC